MGTRLTNSEDVLLVRQLRHMKALREHWDSVAYMKQALKDGDGLKFAEAWSELDNATKTALWIATDKGGIWTTDERKRMREYSNQLRHPSPTAPADIGASCSTRASPAADIDRERVGDI